MDVTKLNFRSVVSEIKTAITDASFLSIDCEFSGLNSDTNINAFDTYQQYYEKLKKSVQNFLIFQFGLSIFRYDKKAKVFKQRCYNFYIFPRRTNKNLPDVKFLCQSSSIDFLASHDFNFNKVFKEGISYLNKPDELKYREVLQEKQKLRANQSFSPGNHSCPIPITEDDKPFVDETMKKIENFIASDKDELILPQCNAFHRRLIYQESSEKFGKRVELETRILENKDRILYVLKPLTPEQRTEKERLRYEQEMLELEDAIGFSTIIQHIAESGKLVVGHNLMLDLLHTVDTFLTPLPDSYEEFKECVNCLFPRIIDTKVMASSLAFKDLLSSTVLNHIIERFQKEPFECPVLEIEESCVGYNLNNKKEHEAGYDAFITGVCFLVMSNYLGKLEKPEVNPLVDNIDILKPYINKIFIMRLQDCPYINLTGSDPKPSRDHVLHITFPKEWKLSEITQLFSPFGNVYVSWLNDRSAYVSLYKREQAALALSTLSQSDTYSVISYARHQALLNTRLPVAPSPSKRKREDTSYLMTSKKRKRDSYLGESSSKQSMETIKEQSEEEPSSIAWKISKMFETNSAWD